VNYYDYIFDDACFEADTLEEVTAHLKQEIERNGCVMQVCLEKVERCTEEELNKLLSALPAGTFSIPEGSVTETPPKNPLDNHERYSFWNPDKIG
jgi:hypothetical protein